jgi:type I restriction enzyme S subunit
VKITDVAAINPRLAKGEIASDTPVSFVPMAAVGAADGATDVYETRPYGAVQKGYTSFAEGDVLFAKITPCMENGKMAVVPKVHNGYGFGSTEFHVLRPSAAIDGRFLYYFVSGKHFRQDAEHNMTGAVGQRRVPTTYFAECEIHLPPLPEQHRIVAKIEELFSELDQGIASLKTAREQLKQTRRLAEFILEVPASLKAASLSIRLTNEERSRFLGLLRTGIGQTFM